MDNKEKTKNVSNHKYFAFNSLYIMSSIVYNLLM